MAKKLREVGIETTAPLFSNYHINYVADTLQVSKSTTKQLDLYSNELTKVLLRLIKVSERMPEGMWAVLGEEIRSVTNTLAESKNALDLAHYARIEATK